MGQLEPLRHGGSSSRTALDEYRAATKIQANFRGHQARQDFAARMRGFGAGGMYRHKVGLYSC
jgi:hypothetical protein